MHRLDAIREKLQEDGCCFYPLDYADVGYLMNIARAAEAYLAATDFPWGAGPSEEFDALKAALEAK